MKLLFENWRGYVNEEEQSDEQKIFSVFLNNGAYGLELAEMTDSPITKDLKEIVDRTRNHISYIESIIEGNVPGHSDDKPQTMYKTVEEFIGHRLEGYGAYTGELAKELSERVHWRMQPQDTWDFTEMLLEAGDYVWWTGAFNGRSSMWSYNVASPESSSAMFNELKKWAGV